MIIWTDVCIVSVFHAKALWYNAKLHKTEFFIQPPRTHIAFYHSVELQHAKAVFFSRCKAVAHKQLAYPLPLAPAAYRKACVAYMTAPADVVRVKNI